MPRFTSFIARVAPLVLVGRQRLKSALSVVALLLLVAMAQGEMMACTAHASETDFIDMSTNQVGGRTLRLGLGKSAVVKLPTVVKDVIVGDPTMVDVIPKNGATAYMFARSVGQTNIFFLDASGRQILQLNLEVTLDTKALKELLDRSLPGNAIQIDSTGKNVVLKGVVLDAQQGKAAEDLAKSFIASYGAGEDSVLNLLKVAEGNQVMLKVRVVELKRTVLKRLGVDLSGTITAGTFKFKFDNVTQAVNKVDTLKGVASFAGPPVKIDATIRALEDSGLATTLAEPTLTAISGAPASFNAGGEYPYNNCNLPDQTTQNILCTTTFRQYGITLNFTPTVLSEGRIALNIYTEVSDLGVNPYNSELPIIDTRNAQTSIELPSGGSMFLAGLIKNTTTQTMENTPGLRSIPLLGGLFSSQQLDRKQSELVVIVTPYIVGATQESELATPLDRFNTATDLQQLFLGRLNKVYGLPESAAKGDVYHGQVGHIIE